VTEVERSSWWRYVFRRIWSYVIGRKLSGISSKRWTKNTEHSFSFVNSLASKILTCRRKPIMITGASSGIENHCSVYYNKEGYQVILSARNEEKLQQVKSPKYTIPKVAMYCLWILESVDFIFSSEDSEAIQAFGKVTSCFIMEDRPALRWYLRHPSCKTGS